MIEHPKRSAFAKKQYREIFDVYQVILILSSAFSIEKEEMTSSLSTLIKESKGPPELRKQQLEKYILVYTTLVNNI